MNREQKDIENYLHNISQGENGFSTPENYFDSVEDSVLAEIAQERLPKQHAFDVPSDYFESFDNELFSKIEFPKKEVKVISIRSRLLKIIPTAAAACILLFVGLNYFSIEPSIDNLSTDEIESWLDEKNVELNSTNPIEFVDADFTESTILEDDSSLEDEDILEYLNTIDSSSLLTEIES